VHQGYDLNLRKKTPIIVAPRTTRSKPQVKSDKDLILRPDEIAPYVRLSYRGEYELDVKTEDKLRIVGIIKEKIVKAQDKEPEVPENPVKEPLQQMIPSKIYTTKQGNTLSSEEMAKTIVEAIEYANQQIQSTTDTRKIKRLNEKLHSIKLYVAMHQDIKQFMD
jgi:hypothetical protein